MSHSNKSLADSKISKFGSNFDKWLQREYLPTGFKCNDQDVKLQTRKRWFRKIQFDFKEIFHIFSIIIIVVWLLSLAIFVLYQLGNCSLISEQREENQTTVIPFLRYGSLNKTNFRSSNRSIRDRVTVNRSIKRSNLVESRGFMQMLGLSAEQSNSDCDIVSIYAIFDFGMATIMVLHLILYLVHIVEMLRYFPWFVVEMVYMAVFVLLVFGLSLALCISSKQNTIVILGIVQSACGMLFILNRYHQYKSGKPPQDLSDDVDGDYIRRLKNIFRPKSTSLEEPKRGKNYKKKFESVGSKQMNVDMFKSKCGDKEPKSKVTASKDHLVANELKSTLKQPNKSVNKASESRQSSTGILKATS